MLYTLEQGPTEKMIIEQCMRENRQLPRAIQGAPELFVGLSLYYGAYLDLQSTRPLGWGDGKISWTSVYEYCLANNYSEEQHEDLQFYVVKLDEAYLNWREAQRAKNKQATGRAERPSRKTKG